MLERYGGKFALPAGFEENEDTFLELLPQLIDQFPLYFKYCTVDSEVESGFFSLISMIQLLSQVHVYRDGWVGPGEGVEFNIGFAYTVWRELREFKVYISQFCCNQITGN